jgi:hypothetical protein
MNKVDELQESSSAPYRHAHLWISFDKILRLMYSYRMYIQSFQFRVLYIYSLILLLAVFDLWKR